MVCYNNLFPYLPVSRSLPPIQNASSYFSPPLRHCVPSYPRYNHLLQSFFITPSVWTRHSCGPHFETSTPLSLLLSGLHPYLHHPHSWSDSSLTELKSLATGLLQITSGGSQSTTSLESGTILKVKLNFPVLDDTHL